MICSKCKQEKDESGFEYRNDTGKFRKVCRECNNARNRVLHVRKAKSLSERRKISREKDKENFNKKARFRYWKNREDLLSKAKSRDSYKKPRNESVKAWREKNKHKCAAHQAVCRALKSGKIKKPKECQMCGKEGKLNAHHPDYKHPLKVIWLCVGCHKKVHSKFFKEEL